MTDDEVVEAAKIGLGEDWPATPKELAQYRDWIVRNAPVVAAAMAQERHAFRGAMKTIQEPGEEAWRKNYVTLCQATEAAARAAQLEKQ